jgi:hypothetical protein
VQPNNPDPDGGTTYQNGFKHLLRELAERTRAPIGHVTFWVYLVLGVILFGGLGVWLEWISYSYAVPKPSSDALRTALITFFQALVGSTSIQLVFAENNKPMRAFAILCLVIFLVPAIWLTLDRSVGPGPAFLLAGIASVAAVWIWWIAHAFEPVFRDQLNVTAPVGGETNVTPPGDLTGFKH